MHMGTVVRVTAVAAGQETAKASAEAAFQEVHRLEELLSTWMENSELSRVNAAAGQEPVSVSSETMEVLNRSLQITAMTGGGFNIAIGPAVEAWSVIDHQRIPSENELRKILPLIDLSQLRLNKADGTVYLARRGMRIDVGGIGKGYAADRAVEAMRKAGATAGVVALAGDIKTFGQLPHAVGVTFGIRHPRNPDALLATVDIRDEAISTAGDYERFFERDGIRYHHILDPATLPPARFCQSVTIIAEEGIMADGLDTGVFVMGPQKGMELIEKLPGVNAVIVDETGHITISSNLRSRINIVSAQDVMAQ
jgi:thiamine biosynthesis lipoprotein